MSGSSILLTTAHAEPGKWRAQADEDLLVFVVQGDDPCLDAVRIMPRRNYEKRPVRRTPVKVFRRGWFRRKVGQDEVMFHEGMNRAFDKICASRVSKSWAREFRERQGPVAASRRKDPGGRDAILRKTKR